MSAHRSIKFAVILGTNEIASAVAVQLHRDGFRVVLSHDVLPPVIRRKMAFHDALYDDAVTVEGITAMRADSGLEVAAGLRNAPGVVITELGLLETPVVVTDGFGTPSETPGHGVAFDKAALAPHRLTSEMARTTFRGGSK